MTNQMLIVFAIFADYAKYNTNGSTVQAAERAMAAFSFFLFLNYAFVGSLLATFRDEMAPAERIKIIIHYYISKLLTHSITVKAEVDEEVEETGNDVDAENGEENAEMEDDNRN